MYKGILKKIDEQINKLVLQEEATPDLTTTGQLQLYLLLENCKHLKEKQFGKKKWMEHLRRNPIGNRENSWDEEDYDEDEEYEDDEYEEDYDDEVGEFLMHARSNSRPRGSMPRVRRSSQGNRSSRQSGNRSSRQGGNGSSDRGGERSSNRNWDSGGSDYLQHNRTMMNQMNTMNTMSDAEGALSNAEKYYTRYSVNKDPNMLKMANDSMSHYDILAKNENVSHLQPRVDAFRQRLTQKL